MHRLHPDPELGDDPDALLYDHCEDCTAAAEQPVFRLDRQRLRDLFARLVAVELAETDHYHSDAERVAVNALWPTYILAQRDPDLYARIAEEARRG